MSKIFPVILDDDLNRKIDEYRLKKGFTTKKECVVELIKKGLKYD